MSAAEILQGIMARLSHSLLQYVRDAFPWTLSADQERLAALRKLIDEEEQAATRLSQLLRRRRIPFPQARYPQNFTNINYISLDSLIQHLIAHEKAEIVQLEREEAKLWNDPEARAQAQAILEMAQRHLQALEGMVAAAAAV